MQEKERGDGKTLFVINRDAPDSVSSKIEKKDERRSGILGQ